MGTLKENAENQEIGLGYCFHCGHEYADSESDGVICPKCLKVERKTYYFFNKNRPSADYQWENEFEEKRIT